MKFNGERSFVSLLGLGVGSYGCYRSRANDSKTMFKEHCIAWSLNHWNNTEQPNPQLAYPFIFIL